MKKKILGGLLVIAIAAVAAFNVNMNTQGDELSLLSLANVEVLAQRENNNRGASERRDMEKRGEFRSCMRPYANIDYLTVNEGYERICIGTGSLDCISGEYVTKSSSQGQKSCIHYF